MILPNTLVYIHIVSAICIIQTIHINHAYQYFSSFKKLWLLILLIHNIIQSQKIKNRLMKTNRSMKELNITKLKFQEEKFIHGHIHPFTPTKLNHTLDNLFKEISSATLKNNYNSSKKIQHLNDKSYRSQKNLEIPIIKFQVTSPKNYEPEIKTERKANTKQDQDKDFENIQITPFDSGKAHYNLKPSEFKLMKVLSPSNRNITVEEPKRPKILNKQRQSLSFFEEFRLGKILGKGRFGNVYRAEHLATRCVFAVKKISLQKVCKKLIERLVWEIKIQSFLNHENCLDLYKFYKEGNYLYLVVELGECSLFDKLRQKRYFTEVETCYYITQTIKALIHLHQLGIIHRDLKPENIVLINNVVKLADFGWSIYIGKNSKRTTFCGTLDYVSPEIVMGNQYDQMVDVWSVGVLCYELCTGHAPFQSSKSREETYKKILNVDLKFPKYLSEDIKDFITKLLIKNPQKRMSLVDAMNHRWVKKYYMST